MVRGPALISRGASAVRKRGALAKGPARPPLWPALHVHAVCQQWSVTDSQTAI